MKHPIGPRRRTRGAGAVPDVLCTAAGIAFASSRDLRILRRAEVLRRATLSRTLWFELGRRRLVPPDVCFGDRVRGVVEHYLDAWLLSCLALRSSMRTLCDPVVLPVWVPPAPEDDAIAAPRGICMLRLSEVLARVPLSRNELYRRMNARLFPWPAPLSEGARRWALHEVIAWMHVHLLASLVTASGCVRRIRACLYDVSGVHRAVSVLRHDASPGTFAVFSGRSPFSLRCGGHFGGCLLHGVPGLY